MPFSTCNRFYELWIFLLDSSKTNVKQNKAKPQGKWFLLPVPEASVLPVYCQGCGIPKEKRGSHMYEKQVCKKALECEHSLRLQ